MSFSILVVSQRAARGARLRATLARGDHEILHATSLAQAQRVLSRRVLHLVVVDRDLMTVGEPTAVEWTALAAAHFPSVPFLLCGPASRANLLATGAAPPAFAGASSGGGRRLRNSVQRVLSDRFGSYAPADRIVVLHSGGDAAGMNAATLAIVGAAHELGAEVLGVRGGYRGLVDGRLTALTRAWLFAHARRAGSCLGTARFPELADAGVRERALRVLGRHHASGLIVVGGEGSTAGAAALRRDAQALGLVLRVVVVPGTMDNDLPGCDRSLGVASAVEALIRAHEDLVASADAVGRVFVTEAMGRYSGFVALRAASAIQAEGVLLPEQLVKLAPSRPAANWRDAIDCRATSRAVRLELSRALARAKAAFRRGQRHAFIIVGEGIRLLTGGKIDVERIARHLERQLRRWPLEIRPDVRTHVVGHRVRGVLAEDDYRLGLKLGRAAARALLSGQDGVMIGWSEDAGVATTPIDEVLAESSLPPAESWTRRPRWEAELREYESLVAVSDAKPTRKSL